MFALIERKGAIRVLVGLLAEGEVNMTRFQQLSLISSSPTAADLRDVLRAVGLVEIVEYRDQGRLNYRISLSRAGERVARSLDDARLVLEGLPPAPLSSVRGLPRARVLHDDVDGEGGRRS